MRLELHLKSMRVSSDTELTQRAWLSFPICENWMSSTMESQWPKSDENWTKHVSWLTATPAAVKKEPLFLKKRKTTKLHTRTRGSKTGTCSWVESLCARGWGWRDQYHETSYQSQLTTSSKYSRFWIWTRTSGLPLGKIFRPSNYSQLRLGNYNATWGSFKSQIS